MKSANMVPVSGIISWQWFANHMSAACGAGHMTHEMIREPLTLSEVWRQMIGWCSLRGQQKALQENSSVWAAACLPYTQYTGGPDR